MHIFSACIIHHMPKGDLALDTFDTLSKTPTQGLTRAEELREKIEELIATGALLPGTRLDETDLAERFGVSRTPIREALIQLASVGILLMRPRRGAIVPEVSPHRLAARRMSAKEHQDLIAAHRACEAARKSEDPDAYYLQNEIFHHVLYAGSHNSFLIEQASALHRRLRPHRRLQLRVRDRIANSFAEHAKVVEAILAGDAELTAECLRAHVIVQGQRFADLIALLNRGES